jgi:transcriptional regulator with XRE-family HTH domain
MISITLKEQRARLGLSLRDVERITFGQIRASRLSLIERGTVLPSAREREALARLFSTSEEKLFPKTPLAVPGADLS